MLYPLVYGVLYMALYIKNSWINCTKLLIIPLFTTLLLVTPWLLILYQRDSLSLVMRSGGLLLDQSAWLDFIPRSTLKTPFFASWVALGVSMLAGIIVSYRNKLFMPLHAFYAGEYNCYTGTRSRCCISSGAIRYSEYVCRRGNCCLSSQVI